MHPRPNFKTDLSSILDLARAINPAQYERTRNHINGDVTFLSPYVTHGILDLTELKDIALEKTSPEKAAKFISELEWREYFQRVWQAKGDEIFEDLRFPQSGVESEKLPQFLEQKNSGIQAVDDALSALLETGYMHNHARMWLAALVCNMAHFNWKNPALWLHYHLLDGDPASNMLSWQWVAGSSRNKIYVMNQKNMNTFSGSKEISWLSVTYEEIEDLSVPSHLKEEEDFKPDLSHMESLQKGTEIKEGESIQLLSIYSLDPRKVDPNKRPILLMEPETFKKRPISKKRLEFILALTKNIANLEVLYAAAAELPEHATYCHTEHPTTENWPGEKKSRAWLHPTVHGYFKSFSQYKRAL